MRVSKMNNHLVLVIKKSKKEDTLSENFISDYWLTLDDISRENTQNFSIALKSLFNQS